MQCSFSVLTKAHTFPNSNSCFVASRLSLITFTTASSKNWTTANSLSSTTGSLFNSLHTVAMHLHAERRHKTKFVYEISLYLLHNALYLPSTIVLSMKFRFYMVPSKDHVSMASTLFSANNTIMQSITVFRCKNDHCATETCQ